MKLSQIKISFCVAYDWYLLAYSLPLVYEDADEICLAIDKDRISWSGNAFEFDESAFRNLIASIDTHQKIRVYEDDFHLPELSPMQNEVRQRKMMAEFLGAPQAKAWYLQLDADEYFLDFKGFVYYLRQFNPKRPINVCCPWMTLYKRIDEGFLMVKPDDFNQVEFIPIATNVPNYEHGRRNGYFNHYTDFSILHQSWARTAEEVWQKLNNWGHRYDSDIHSYFKLWANASILNFKEYKDFNQVNPPLWPRLELLSLPKNASVLDLIRSGLKLPLVIKRKYLRRKNSIWISRLNSIIQKK